MAEERLVGGFGRDLEAVGIGAVCRRGVAGTRLGGDGGNQAAADGGRGEVGNGIGHRVDEGAVAELDGDDIAIVVMASQGDLIDLGNRAVGGLNRCRFNSAISNDTSVDINGACDCGGNRIGYGVVNSRATTGDRNDSTGDRGRGGVGFRDAAADIVSTNR